MSVTCRIHESVPDAGSAPQRGGGSAFLVLPRWSSPPPKNRISGRQKYHPDTLAAGVMAKLTVSPNPPRPGVSSGANSVPSPA